MQICVYDHCGKFESDSDTIDYCLSLFIKNENNTLIFSNKTWLIDRAVLLPSDTTVIVDNCTIKQADFTYDNIFRGNNLVFENEMCFPAEVSPISNIKIVGKGNAVLEGPDKNKRMFHPVLKEEQEMTGDFYGFRTHQISFTMISGCEISGLSIIKTRGWAICFDLSNNIHIHDIHFNSNVKNGDGIDFRSGTHNCIVEKITGRTSDDTVACTALSDGKQKLKSDYPVRNYLYPSEPGACAVKSRGPKETDIHDVTIRDVCTSGRHHGIICLAANGSKVYNITIENISEPEDEWRESTVKIYTGYGNGYTDGDIHDIYVKNVRSLYAQNAVYCNTAVKNVTLENISHTNPQQRIKLDYPDNVKVL